MFYQSQHSLDADVFKLEQETDFNYPAHLHNSVEVITLTEGSMEVTVDGKLSVLEAGRYLTRNNMNFIDEVRKDAETFLK